MSRRLQLGIILLATAALLAPTVHGRPSSPTSLPPARTRPGPSPRTGIKPQPASRGNGELLEGLRRFILSRPPERLAGRDAAQLRGTKIDELLKAARGGRLTDHDVASFAQSARPTTLAALEQNARLPRGFFLTTTRSVVFPGGNPFQSRKIPAQAEERRLRAELVHGLESIARLDRRRGGRALTPAIQLLTSSSHLLAPRSEAELSAAIREAVERIPLLELEQRHAYVTGLSPERVLAQMATRAKLAKRDDLVNFDHLIGTLGHVKDGKLLVDIYAENLPAPGKIARYVPVAALGEGNYCVDDIARSTVALLQAYQQRRRPTLLASAKAGIRFVTMMQASDGEFYNFASLNRGRIEVNREGKTSKKGIDYWAVRGLWALGQGYATLQNVDPGTATTLDRAIQRSLPALEKPLRRYGQYTSVAGKRLPAWLINNATDQTSVAVKGLLAYYRALPSGRSRQRVGSIISKFCDGIAASQITDPRAPDYGRFLHTTQAPADRHLWGSHQVEALAEAGKLLARPEWIRAAALCADHYWGRATPKSIITPREDEIAYGVETVVSGFARLYEATGRREYVEATYRWASWFLGNNSARFVMYDPMSGRGYDGITHVSDPKKGTRYSVNANSGAESTVESILALQSAARVPGVHDRLRKQLARVLPR